MQVMLQALADAIHDAESELAREDQENEELIKTDERKQLLKDDPSLQRTDAGTEAAADPFDANNLHAKFLLPTKKSLDDEKSARLAIRTASILKNRLSLAPGNIQSTLGGIQFSPPSGAACPFLTDAKKAASDQCRIDPQCAELAYRSFDGTCNNLKNRFFGSAQTPFKRYLGAVYSDGVEDPRKSLDEKELPSARLLSTQVTSIGRKRDSHASVMLMQWGQFIDHDIVHTPMSTTKSGQALVCCRGCTFQAGCRLPRDCFPIKIPQDDHQYAQYNIRCLNFARSLPAVRPDCELGPREQINQFTSYIDGSHIYGSNKEEADELREFGGGRLRVMRKANGRSSFGSFRQQQAFDTPKKDLLPHSRDQDDCNIDKTISSTRRCFLAGDSFRVNEQIGLTTLHTTWMREHNRIAKLLQELNPHWSDDRLYHEARRIVGAELQHITYNEWLPIVIGNDLMNKHDLRPRAFGFYYGYDPKRDATIANVFAAAAYRFGHSLIPDGFFQSNAITRNSRGLTCPFDDQLNLTQVFQNPSLLHDKGGVESMVGSLTQHHGQRMDTTFSRSVRDLLFKVKGFDIGLDIVALNIQRGRDHGIPGYNDWREFCGLERAYSFTGFASEIGRDGVKLLEQYYSSVDDVDAYLGMILEESIEGATVGPTVGCLLAQQFSDLKRGDRFFYENYGQSGSFTERQLHEIKKASHARHFCDNTEGIQRIQRNVFIVPYLASTFNQAVDCSSQPFVDLDAWEEK